MTAGKALYMLVEEQPVGIVSVQGNLIENLYVLPGQQNRGWGSRLLEFAMEQCDGMLTLWVMNINEGAYRLYTRWGFTETGNRKQLNGDLYEMELARAGGADDLHRLAVRHIYGNGVQEDDGLAYAPDST